METFSLEGVDLTVALCMEKRLVIAHKGCKLLVS